MKKEISNNENYSLATVQRALTLLEWVASRQQEPTVREAADELGLNITTCYRLVETLGAAHYIIRQENRRLRLGPKVAALHQAFSHHFQPTRDFLTLLKSLCNKTRETSYLAAWDQGDLVLQAIVEGPETLRVAGLYVGLRGAAHCRASGKAILAHLNRTELETFLRSHPLKPYTPYSITDRDALHAALEKVRGRGYAIDNQEFANGVCCVAAPYFDAGRTVRGAIAVSLPASRFHESKRHICRSVVDAGRRASLLLGYTERHPAWRSDSTAKGATERPARGSV